MEELQDIKSNGSNRISRDYREMFQLVPTICAL